jgi:orotate phosphoribosyltransferase
MSFLKYGQFKGASGKILDWKIECDAFDLDDWIAAAKMAQKIIGPYRAVYGVPRGGVPFAAALASFVDPQAHSILVVDDVWTTGKSLYEYVNTIPGLKPSYDAWKGLVVYSRNPMPSRIQSIFQVNAGLFIG